MEESCESWVSFGSFSDEVEGTKFSLVIKNRCNPGILFIFFFLRL